MKPTDADTPPTNEPEGAAEAPTPPPAPRRHPAAWVGGALALLLVGLLLGRWTSPAAPTAGAGDPAPAAQPTEWTCSMHPQIRSPTPGTCPICGMDLIPVGGGGDDLGPRELRLSPGAVTLAEVETEPVRRQDVARQVRMVGKVDFDETRLNYITAWIPGRLDRMYVDYTGTLVRKDDHLVQLYSPQLLSAQEELLQALKARQTFRDGSSKLMLETAEQTVRSSREKLRLWGLGLDQIEEIERSGQTSDHVTIRAPIGGIVVHKNKNTGDYVNTGERVYTIADLSRVWIQLDAYESDLPWVRYGQTVRFETESYPGVPFEGRVVFVDPVLSGDTRTVKVRLNVDNSTGRLKPGMFVRAVLQASLQAEGQTLDPSLVGKWICPMHWDVIHDAQGACDQCGMPLVRAESLHLTGDPGAELPLVVPASAVLWTGVRSLVYLKLPGDEALFRGQEIVLGPRAGDFYVVRSGLDEGDVVVTQGAFKLDSALQIEARPSMMLPPEGQREAQAHDAPPAFLAALDPVYAGYLAVQEALAGDDLQAARTAAEGLVTQAQGVDMSLVTGTGHVAWMGLAKRLRDGGGAVAAADTIAAARVAFVELSAATLDLERQFGHAAGVLREAYCPMARDNEGASWLQRGEEVLNPYFGSSMLRCGEVRATFPAKGEGGRK
ncbi:MAG: efflux RND transporter periplasmic adaptor subunit [Planctomycetes bacterium]|nr:efflux RND transporter periplasmic adaptor subunit [Planctomycetota bacterium]